MEVFKTPGAFSWTELMCPDPKAATEFYGRLFGWKFEPMDMGEQGTYHVVKIGDQGIGGIMAPPPQAAGAPTTWGTYVTVADVDATARKCTELGGTVCMPPTDIPKVGRFTVLQDPQGATLMAITYDPSMA